MSTNLSSRVCWSHDEAEDSKTILQDGNWLRLGALIYVYSWLSFFTFSLKGPIAFIKTSYVHNKWDSHTPFLIR